MVGASIVEIAMTYSGDPPRGSLPDWAVNVVIVGVLAVIVALSGFYYLAYGQTRPGYVVRGNLGSPSGVSPAPTFSDSSRMSPEIVQRGEVCNEMYPFDDDAFTRCMFSSP